MQCCCLLCGLCLVLLLCLVPHSVMGGSPGKALWKLDDPAVLAAERAERLAAAAEAALRKVSNALDKKVGAFATVLFTGFHRALACCVNLLYHESRHSTAEAAVSVGSCDANRLQSAHNCPFGPSIPEASRASSLIQLLSQQSMWVVTPSPLLIHQSCSSPSPNVPLHMVLGFP